jgi:DeoR/GlpR family transcriptional regulator of sugar metabolism
MKSLDRRKKIIKIIKNEEQVTIKEIAKITAEKESNIRRDIRILKEMGLLSKIYGGVKTIDKHSLIENYFYNEIKNDTEKELIAKKALEFINENDSVFLGAGTTVFKLAEMLYQSDIKLNVITIALPVATLLAKRSNINLIFIGGALIKENYSFEGPFVSELLKYFSVDRAFMGVLGFSYEHGFTIPKIEQVNTIKSIAYCVDEINILVDYTKFLKKCLMVLSTFDDELIKNKIRRVITNKNVDLKNIRRLEESGAKVILV